MKEIVVETVREAEGNTERERSKIQRERERQERGWLKKNLDRYGSCLMCKLGHVVLIFNTRGQFDKGYGHPYLSNTFSL